MRKRRLLVLRPIVAISAGSNRTMTKSTSSSQRPSANLFVKQSDLGPCKHKVRSFLREGFVSRNLSGIVNLVASVLFLLRKHTHKIGNCNPYIFLYGSFSISIWTFI